MRTCHGLTDDQFIGGSAIRRLRTGTPGRPGRVGSVPSLVRVADCRRGEPGGYHRPDPTEVAAWTRSSCNFPARGPRWRPAGRPPCCGWARARPRCSDAGSPAGRSPSGCPTRASPAARARSSRPRTTGGCRTSAAPPPTSWRTWRARGSTSRWRPAGSARRCRSSSPGCCSPPSANLPPSRSSPRNTPTWTADRAVPTASTPSVRSPSTRPPSTSWCCWRSANPGCARPPPPPSPARPRCWPGCASCPPAGG